MLYHWYMAVRITVDKKFWSVLNKDHKQEGKFFKSVWFLKYQHNFFHFSLNLLITILHQSNDNFCTLLFLLPVWHLKTFCIFLNLAIASLFFLLLLLPLTLYFKLNLSFVLPTRIFLFSLSYLSWCICVYCSWISERLIMHTPFICNMTDL